jgi:hypothetical protein
MNSMVARRYKITNAKNPKGRYWKPSIVITKIPNHKNGHFVRPNKVAFRYFDLKKNVDLNVHVKMFNSVVKENAKTFKEYIINAFSYTLKDITSD